MEWQIFDLQAQNFLSVPVDDHTAYIVLAEFMYQLSGGIAIAADNIERFLRAPYLAGKGGEIKYPPKRLVLNQCQYGADCIQPGHYSSVDNKGSPHALCIGKCIGDLTKTDSRTQEADKIDSVEEIHAPGVTLIIDTGNQRHAEYRNRINRNQHDQRQAHAPQ